MSILINIITVTYCIAIAFFFAMSLPRLMCWTHAFKKQSRLNNPKQNKLAVLIPARNESMSVGNLFEDISAQSYPRERYDVHVIVSDSEDATIEMARRHGFIPLVVADQTCKSDALDACFQGILSEDPYKYDAYIIIDADCGLDKNFLEEMNNALASGADIICSKKVVKNYFYGTKKKCTLSACCNGIIWTLLDNMGNKYKSAKGYPCFTVGTGLMLTGNLIRDKKGWPYKQTLTEDAELMHDAALDHRKFFYYEHAVLYMEEAQKLSVTNKRRHRWLTGVVQCERLYRKKTSKACTWGERYYTSALNYIYGYVGASAVFAMIMGILTVALALTRSFLWSRTLTLALAGVAVIYLSFLIMTVLAMLCDRQYIKLSVCRKVLLALVHPLFYMQYIYIVGKPLLFPARSKGDTWEVIDRVNFSDNK